MNELADLLERFRRGAEIVATATTGAAGSELDFQPATSDGKTGWGVRTVVCHLADAEVAMAMRLRQVIAEDNPTLQAWDQDLWAQRLGYGKRKMSDAMDTFRRVRADNYELLKELPAETFSRTATHTERGKLTLLDLVQGLAQHPEGHVRQIQAARAAYKAHRAATQAK
jgi:hypothetical protein